MKILKLITTTLILVIGGFTIAVLSIGTLRSQIMEISGPAVAQSPIRWNNIKDAAVGDDQTIGIAVVSPYLYDGTNFDPARGDTTNGMWVNVKSSVIPTGVLSGTAFYAIKRDNITNPASVNLAFGFTSKKVVIETDPANTDEVVVDWLGGTAVAPAANTAGDDRIKAGRIVTFDDYAVTSISVIAASGTQTIYIRAFN